MPIFSFRTFGEGRIFGKAHKIFVDYVDNKLLINYNESYLVTLTYYYNIECGVACLPGGEVFCLAHRRSRKSSCPGGVVGMLLGQLKCFVGGHPIWMALFAGVAVSLVFLLIMPLFLENAVEDIQPEDWTPDWFSFFGSWVTGVVSALVGVISIIMAVRISNQQAEQAKQLNDMQASLTMAMNLPSLHVSQVRFRRTDDLMLEGHLEPRTGPFQYKLEMHTPMDAFPAHYRVELQCSWSFSGHTNEQLHMVQLKEKHWKLSLSHAGKGTCLAIDFDCAKQDQDYFTRFYEASERNLNGIRSAQIILKLELENRLLASVLRNAGMDSGERKPKSTVELCISLRNLGKYVNDRKRSNREPDIVVEDYSVSVL